MQEFIRKLVVKIRYYFSKSTAAAAPALLRLRQLLDGIRTYFKEHPKARRWTLFVGIPALLGFLLLIFVWIETPSKNELRDVQNFVAAEVYSEDSVLLGRYYIQDRTEVEYEDLSPAVISALIATEDARFFEHDGVDYKSMGRVFIKSILMQEESAGGGSTIAQQLAKNLYPRKRYWVLAMVVNKMREIITAHRLESMYSKKDLLTLYLNTIPFADNTFGIQAAAKRFFSLSARELSPDQAATLIGMLKATTYYNPRRYPERALERRNVVLSQMVKYNFLEEEKADKLKEKPLALKYNKVSYHQGLAPYFREFLKSELLTWCKNNSKPDGSPYNLYRDGLKIYTTIDSKLQTYAEKALEQQMAEVQKQFQEHWGKEKPWKGNEGLVTEAIHRSPRYQNLKSQGLSEDEIMEAMNKPVATRLFTWKGDEETKMSPIDSIKHHLQLLNAGFVAIEPSTGKVKAWVGGIDYNFFQFDHVKPSTKRQVGSIFKPIVYAAAIEQGVPPCELQSASQKTYIDKEGDKWTPRNMQNDYQVEYSMRGALAYSVNTVSVKLIEKAGVENTIKLAKKLGITSEMPDVPSIALGSSSISLLEMTTAYAAIANEGVTNLPYFINSIEDQKENKFDDFKPQGSGKRAISKETALLVRQMMQTVVHEGTASRIRYKYGVYSDVAGKTGTTQANADGWFMAITPKLVIGTWVGADDPRIRFRNSKLGQGSNTALPITGYFLKQVNQDPTLEEYTKAKFSPLHYTLQQKLRCDLYELNDNLWQDIQRMIFKRDSTNHADTTVRPKEETFLEMLYRRKMKILEADSANVKQLEIVEGG